MEVLTVLMLTTSIIINPFSFPRSAEEPPIHIVCYCVRSDKWRSLSAMFKFIFKKRRINPVALKEHDLKAFGEI